MNTTYKLEELAAAAGVSPRTVRYYVQRGLLPAPEFRGKDTEYTRLHLLRLRAIKQLQEAYLPLDEIQVRLANATEAELERLAKGKVQTSARRPLEEPLNSDSGKQKHPYRSAPGGAKDTQERSQPAEDFPLDPKATAHVYTLATGVELWVRSALPASSRALVRELLIRYSTLEEKDPTR